MKCRLQLTEKELIRQCMRDCTIPDPLFSKEQMNKGGNDILGNCQQKERGKSAEYEFIVPNVY